MDEPRASPSAHIELLVEPFREADPGAHVVAALECLADYGLSVEMGPFASSAEAPLDQLIAALGPAVVAAFDTGADAIQVRIERR